MTKEFHPFPAYLSLFIPGLGQVIKGQFFRAVKVWGLILLPWILYFIAGAFYGSQSEKAAGKALGFIILPAILTVILWLWQVIDAYRRPA